MAVPIPDAPAAGNTPADVPASTPAAVVTEPQAATPGSATPPTPAEQTPGSGSAALGADADSLSELSEEERQTFGKAVNALPEVERGLFKKLLTQKTQGIAAARKEVEAKAELIRAIQTDPVGTAQAILAEAQKNGLAAGQSASASPTAGTAGVAASTAVTKMREALGPELSFIADAIAPSVEEMVRQTAHAEIAPVKARFEAEDEKARTSAAENAATAFAGRHPDWKQHQERMAQLRELVTFPDSVPLGDQLEHLYYMAAGPAAASAANTTKTAAVVERINASAAAAASSAPAQGVPASRVTATTPKKLTFREAAEAAKREVEGRVA